VIPANAHLDIISYQTAPLYQPRVTRQPAFADCGTGAPVRFLAMMLGGSGKRRETELADGEWANHRQAGAGRCHPVRL